jgi:hypothetical protein
LAILGTPIAGNGKSDCHRTLKSSLGFPSWAYKSACATSVDHDQPPKINNNDIQYIQCTETKWILNVTNVTIQCSFNVPVLRHWSNQFVPPRFAAYLGDCRRQRHRYQLAFWFLERSQKLFVRNPQHMRLRILWIHDHESWSWLYRSRLG